jgi:hypothetical protein
MLYGCQNIYVYRDHKNNTFNNLQTQCVLCWRLFLEDYAVQFRYMNGESNSLADALSRLPFDERLQISTIIQEITILKSFYSLTDDEDLRSICPPPSVVERAFRAGLPVNSTSAVWGRSAAEAV